MKYRYNLSIFILVIFLGSCILSGCSFSTDTKTTGNSKDVLANKNARIAIAMSIDKQALCDVILNNGSFPNNRFTVSKLAYNNSLDYADLTKEMGYSYNEDLAKQSWAKAKEEVGFDNVELQLVTFDDDSGRRMGEFIQGELKDLDGLNVVVTNLPLKQKLEKESIGDFDLSLSSWGADYPDPLTFLSTMVPGGKFADQTGYNNTAYNKLIAEAMQLPKSQSYELYSQAEEILLDDAYIAPIYQKCTAYLEKDYVSDIIVNSWGSGYTYTYADVKKDNKELNLIFQNDIPTLDVSKATDSVSIRAINMIMDGLTRIDSNGNVQPAIATSWESSNNNKTWTFKLRRNATWSNGEPVTAHDFEYSWKRTIDPNTNAEYAYIMNDIEGAKEVNEIGLENVGVRALDDYTLQVDLNRVVEYFPELVSFQIFYPQNQNFIEQCGSNYGTNFEYQLYNGAFIIANWKIEDQIIMKKNENYWDCDNVNLSKINIKVVKDSGVGINLYEKDEVDQCILTGDYVDKYIGNPEYKVKYGCTTYMLQINVKNR